MQSLEGLRAGEYKGSKRVKISNGISEFPVEVLDLYDTLEVLDLSGNPITQLPDNFHLLHKLKIAFFSDCNFKIFPKQLALCRSLEMVAFKGNQMATIPEDAFPRKLRWLILTNNQLETIPSSIGFCHRLQKCMLAGNRLSVLPDEMSNCRKLGLLRLSANKISVLPSWLFHLPELSFLSFAGNPCAPSYEGNILDEVAWSELSIEQLLGEGASGVISRATLQSNGVEQHVAVKLFKGEVTSDGSPIDEMNACITAGQHPNLISPIGKIRGHPQKKGLVLELIPPHYKNLGLPPTLDTCTRDVFPADTRFDMQTCIAILRSIASAATHIHARGIAHGDLYAHNILIEGSGHGLLGDFGAATIYPSSFEHADLIEQIEVLAFGHLLEDMMVLLDRETGISNGSNILRLQQLSELHFACCRPVVTQRPAFKQVCHVLNTL